MSTKTLSDIDILNKKDCYEYLKNAGVSIFDIRKAIQNGETIQDLVKEVAEYQGEEIPPRTFAEFIFDKDQIRQDVNNKIKDEFAAELGFEKLANQEKISKEIIHVNKKIESYCSGIDFRLNDFNPSINIDVKSRPLCPAVERTPVLWVNDPFCRCRIKKSNKEVDETSIAEYIKKYENDLGYRKEIVDFINEDIYTVFAVQTLIDGRIRVIELGSIPATTFYKKAHMVYRYDKDDKYHKINWQFDLGGKDRKNTMSLKECVIWVIEERKSSN